MRDMSTNEVMQAQNTLNLDTLKDKLVVIDSYNQKLSSMLPNEINVNKSNVKVPVRETSPVKPTDKLLNGSEKRIELVSRNTKLFDILYTEGLNGITDQKGYFYFIRISHSLFTEIFMHVSEDINRYYDNYQIDRNKGKKEAREETFNEMINKKLLVLSEDKQYPEKIKEHKTKISGLLEKMKRKLQPPANQKVDQQYNRDTIGKYIDSAIDNMKNNIIGLSDVFRNSWRYLGQPGESDYEELQKQIKELIHLENLRTAYLANKAIEEFKPLLQQS